MFKGKIKIKPINFNIILDTRRITGSSNSNNQEWWQTSWHLKTGHLCF